MNKWFFITILLIIIIVLFILFILFYKPKNTFLGRFYISFGQFISERMQDNMIKAYADERREKMDYGAIRRSGVPSPQIVS